MPPDDLVVYVTRTIDVYVWWLYVIAAWIVFGSCILACYTWSSLRDIGELLKYTAKTLDQIDTRVREDKRNGDYHQDKLKKLTNPDMSDPIVKTFGG